MGYVQAWCPTSSLRRPFASRLRPLIRPPMGDVGPDCAGAPQGETKRRGHHELTNYGIARCRHCVRSDGHRAIGATGDTPRSARRRLFDAVVAKWAGFIHFGRSESLDVETGSHFDQVNEFGTMPDPQLAQDPVTNEHCAGFPQRCGSSRQAQSSRFRITMTPAGVDIGR